MSKTSVNLLCTTDVHGYLDKGLAQFPSLIGSMEADLIIDNGDFFVGSPFATFGYCSKTVTPLVEVANELGYDIMIPGNHDLDYGLNWLKQQVSYLDAAYVCANLFDREDQLIFDPYALIERNSIKIGIIGLMTHGLGQLLPEAVVNQVKTASPSAILAELLPVVSNMADIVIVAYHGGLTRDPFDGKVWHYPSLEDQAYELMAGFPEIDSLICGHQHFVNADTHKEFGTALIQPGYFGQVVGYQSYEFSDQTRVLKQLENRIIPLKQKDRYVTRFDQEYLNWLNEALDTEKLIHYLHKTYQGDIYILNFEGQTVEGLALELNVPFPVSEYWLTGREVNNILTDLDQQCDVKLPPGKLVDQDMYKIIATTQLISTDYLRKQFLVPLFNDFMTS